VSRALRSQAHGCERIVERQQAMQGRTAQIVRLDAAIEAQLDNLRQVVARERRPFQSGIHGAGLACDLHRGQRQGVNGG